MFKNFGGVLCAGIYSRGNFHMASGQKSRNTDKPGAVDGCICAICVQPIIDQSPTSDGEDSIFCEGMCKKWVHCTCAGLTDPVFDMLHRSGIPFRCYHCRFVFYLAEIESLRTEISNLSGELSHIKALLNSPSSMAATPVLVSDVAAVSDVVETTPPQAAITTRVSPPVNASPKVHYNISSNERKFNTIAFGLPECPKGTDRDTRVSRDEEAIIVSVIGEKVSTFNALQMRDCVRLGRYVESSRNPCQLMFSLFIPFALPVNACTYTIIIV